MRMRLLAFLPFSILVTLVLLLGASSLVSALDRTIIGIADSPDASSLIPLQQYESHCEALYREIHDLSHAATRCDERPECAGSPLLCPAAMDEAIDRDFKRLRRLLSEQCGLPRGLMDYAWGGPIGEEPVCGAAHDWLEAATSGETTRSNFVF